MVCLYLTRPVSLLGLRVRKTKRNNGGLPPVRMESMHAISVEVIAWETANEDAETAGLVSQLAKWLRHICGFVAV